MPLALEYLPDIDFPNGLYLMMIIVEYETTMFKLSVSESENNNLHVSQSTKEL